MRLPVAACCLLLSLPGVAGAQSYHARIQEGLSVRVSDADFAWLESRAAASPADPAVYPDLISSYAPTTDRAWAAIYGEVACNLLPDGELSAGAGAGLFALLDGAIDLAEASAVLGGLHGQGPEQGAPMSAYYGVTLLHSLVHVRGAVTPEEKARGNVGLDIALLHYGRLQQLKSWKHERLPETALTRWQRQVLEAGHFEAYNYWLFRGARPREFASWKKASEDAYAAWLSWRSTHPFDATSGDFLRTYRHPLPVAPPREGEAGFGPWMLGMTRAEVASFKEFGPYGHVKATNGLEVRAAKLGERELPASFLFDSEGRLAQIQLWLYVGKDEAEALAEGWEAQAYLRGCCGEELISGELPSVPSERVAFLAVLDQVAPDADGSVKIQFAPAVMPPNLFVHAGLYRSPEGGWFTFLFFNTPPH